MRAWWVFGLEPAKGEEGDAKTDDGRELTFSRLVGILQALNQTSDEFFN